MRTRCHRHRAAAALTVALAVGITGGVTAMPAGAQSTATAAAPPPVEFSPDVSGHAEFGGAVALDGGTAVVGAAEDDTGRPGSGSAFVYVAGDEGWAEQAKLAPARPDRFGNFGYSVAVSGDTALIGEPYGSTDGSYGSGSAYVFVRSGTSWTEQARLVPSVIGYDSNAGWSVALQGDIAVVGVPGGGTSRGAVSIFQRSGTTWTEVAVLEDPTLEGLEAFGSAVAIDGDTLAIGQSASQWSPGDEETNSLYIYVGADATWTQQAVLDAPTDLGDSEASFAVSVDVDGDTVVAGASGADPDGVRDAGAAYVYERDGTTWTEQARLTAAEPHIFDGLGDDVAVAGRLIALGAYNYQGDEYTGAVAVFRRTDDAWTQRRLLTPTAAGTRFGFAVDLDKEDGVRSLLVGAPYDDRGSAYLYQW